MHSAAEAMLNASSSTEPSHVWQVAMLLLVAMGVTVVTTMATAPTEETTTQAMIVATVALLKETMAMVAMEATLLVVSHFPRLDQL